MSDISVCPKCKKEFELNEENSSWYDDDENERGEHKWDVCIFCPFCSYDYWDEIWDDFSDEVNE